MNIASEIKSRRIALGLTQAQLAEKVGVGRTYITDIESGRKSPSLDTITPILAALGGQMAVRWE